MDPGHVFSSCTAQQGVPGVPAATALHRGQENCEHRPRNFAMQGHELKPTSAPGKRPQLPHDMGRPRTHSLTPGDIPPLGTATARLPQARARPNNFLDSQLGQQTRAAVTHLGAAESSGCWSGSGAAVADEGPRRWASA